MALFVQSIKNFLGKAHLKIAGVVNDLSKSRTQSTLCCCADVPRHNFWPYASLHDFEDAAQRGCTRCWMISTGISKYAEQWKGIPSSEVRVGIPGRNLIGGNLSEIWVRWLDRGQRQVWEPAERWIKLDLELYYDKGGNALFPGMRPRANVPVSSFSDTCFNTINAWIDKCSVSHSLCNAGNEHLFLPTRLIDVSPENCESGVRLVETANLLLDESVKYTALSHSWGLKEQRIKPIPKTRKDSLPKRLDHVPWEELTQTFQDGIMVARRLGLRYIWIDALCIIQDDKDDFAMQAKQMAEIYGRAHLVISAMRAATGDVGIFHHRPGAHTVSRTDDQGKVSTVFVKQRLVHNDFITGEPRDFKTSPLFARAWCFQERLLARRVVHFSQNEIVWECNQELLCECNAIRIDSTAETGSNFKRRQALAMQDSSVQVRHRTWYDVLRAYTARSLTVESDRLPALSGFAHRIAIPEMGRYCAGLWEQQLPMALLWRGLRALPEKDGRIERPDKYHAPSWAWPSVQAVIEGYISYLKDSEVVAQVLEVKCQPATADPFGELAGGYIVLNAPVLTAVLQQDEVRASEERHYLLVNVHDEDDRQPFLADVSLAEGYPEHVPLGSQVLCLIIERFYNYVNANRAACLILRQDHASDSEAGNWYRIGTFNCPAHWLSKVDRREVKIL